MNSSPLLGEFLGTLVLILLGNGAVANACLKHSKAEGAGWVSITAGWAFGVMAGVFTALASGAPGHLNPAVTLGAAVQTGDYSRVVPFSLAQLAGAAAGAVLVWLSFLPHWAETPDIAVKQACFCTAPAIRKLPANALAEIIATTVLVLVATAIGSCAVTGGHPAPGLGPYLVASLVWGIGLSLGGTTGYAINPARDLGPRIMHSLLPIAGKGPSGWDYALVPIVGPLAGGALAGFAARLIHL